MNVDSSNEEYIKKFALVYAPITLLFTLTILAVFWFGGRDDPQEVPNRQVIQGEVVEGDIENSPTTTIIAFGDSITAGYGIDLKDSYPAQLERMLQEAGYQVEVINAGVSGETTAGGLRRAEFIAKQEPKIVILALGGNDMLRGIDPKETRKNLEGMLGILTQAGVKVVLAGMQASFNLGPEFRVEFNKIYPELAKQYSVAYVPFILEDVALRPTLNQDDGIHPNKQGATVIAEQNILPKILPLLK